VKEKIYALKQQNPKWGYIKLAKALGCHKNIVRYHLNPNYKAQKLKNKIKRIKRKKEILVQEKGGKCARCGYDKCSGALEFHHLNPNEKETEISNIKDRSLERIRIEADKCLLLCCLCHREFENGIWSLALTKFQPN